MASGVTKSKFRFLLHGLDTVQVCYYFFPGSGSGIDFEWLAVERERLRADKKIQSKAIVIGGQEFLLSPNGSGSGYPFVIRNADYKIECGPHNNPPFYVTFRSEALWREGAHALHERFCAWAEKLGYGAVRPEKLSRMDFCFDYYLPVVDFDEDSFVSLSAKDRQHRERGQLQTFSFGKGDVVLRVYDKIAEIVQQSGKVWMFDLWGVDSHVWRIEWQCRKDILKRFGIVTLDDWGALQGDLLRMLATEHDTLRIKKADSNRSRWPLHPVWQDLQQRIAELDAQGVWRVDGRAAGLREQQQRPIIMVNGYVKRYAALWAARHGGEIPNGRRAIAALAGDLAEVHDPLTWKVDVMQRLKEIQLGP